MNYDRLDHPSKYSKVSSPTRTVLAVIKFNFHDANHKSRLCSPLWLLVFSEYFSELDFVVCCISLFDKLLWFSLSRVNQVF